MLSEKPWQPERVLVFLLRVLGSMFIGIFMVALLQASQWFDQESFQFVSILVLSTATQGAALVFAHFLLRDHGLTWPEAFGFGSPNLARTLAFALIVACLILPAASLLAVLSAKVLTLLHLKPVAQEPIQALQKTGSLAVKCLIGASAIGLAPVAEELVFRGVIYPVLKQRGHPGLAMWGTSFLFATIHFNRTTLLPLAFLALVWTWLYERTDNLLAPILAHSVFNLANFVLALTYPLNPLEGGPP